MIESRMNGTGLYSDQVVSLEEIQTAIKSAEKGPFMTVQEAMNDFEQWLKSWQKR
jgi:hypothetical protein